MKKRNLMMLLLVGAMTGTMLIGCGGSGSTVNGESDVTAENQQGDGSSDAATDETSESGVVNTEMSLVADVTEITASTEVQTPENNALSDGSESAEVVDDGTFYGLKLTPYGEEVMKAWHIPYNEETEEGGVVTDLPVSAEVTTNVTEDGKYEKTVTYTIKTGGVLEGDWTVFMFDYATGEYLLAADSEHTAYGSETTMLEDGTNIWSATLVSPQETDSVFVWGQLKGDRHDLTTIDDDAHFNITDYPDTFNDSVHSNWVFLTTH